MNRRELLKMIAVLTGASVVGAEFWLSGCKAGGKADVGFTPNNLALLDEIGETIIPATTTPGAKAAKVGEFMKVMVTDCYDENNQKIFAEGIAALQAKDFMSLNAAKKKELLIALDKGQKDKAAQIKRKALQGWVKAVNSMGSWGK